MGKRREQFNFRTSMLSDEAYKLLEHLSETRQLSQKIAAWAEQEIKKSKHTPQNDTSTEILKEIKKIKRMIQTSSLQFHYPHTQDQLPEKNEALQLVSSNTVNNVIDDEDESYDY